MDILNKVKPGGRLVTQFAVMLQNRAGAFEALLSLLNQSHIELLGISVQDSRDATVARIVVSDPETAAQIFMEKGIPYTDCQLIVIAFRHPDVELKRLLEVCRFAETNIDFAYALLPHPEGKTLMAFHLEDSEFGAGMLRQSGFQVVCQTELSR